MDLPEARRMAASSTKPARVGLLRSLALTVVVLPVVRTLPAHGLSARHDSARARIAADSSPTCAAIRVALDSLGQIEPVTGNVVVLESLTVAYNDGRRTTAFFEYVRGLHGMAPTTYQSFLQRNTVPHGVCPYTEARDSIVVEPAPPSYTSDAWAIFRRDHPDAKAWVRISEAGISADGGQAFVIVEWAVHERGGARYYVLLNRDGERSWQVTYIAREQTSD